MINKSLLGAFLVIAMTAVPSARGHLVETRGGVPCSTWTQQRPKASKHAEVWLIGFLSGMAQAADIHLPTEPDNEALFRWVDDYCSQNPKKPVSMARFVMFGKLRAGERLK